MPIHLPRMDPCYFCECVLAGSRGWNFIAQEEHVLTLLNGRQYEAGQCIVLPARHATTLLELNDAECAAVMRAARRIAAAMVEAFDPDGVLLYQNNGEFVGQEVPHFHLHVVPRRRAGGWGSGPPQLAMTAGDLPAHKDYAKVTDDKVSAVAQLRQQLGSGPFC